MLPSIIAMGAAFGKHPGAMAAQSAPNLRRGSLFPEFDWAFAADGIRTHRDV
jgi:hypothetical protein